MDIKIATSGQRMLWRILLPVCFVRKSLIARFEKRIEVWMDDDTLAPQRMHG